MTLNDLFNQHINLALFILEDLKATDNQKNLFKNLTRTLQRSVLNVIENAISPDDVDQLLLFISDSKGKKNEKTY